MPTQFDKQFLHRWFEDNLIIDVRYVTDITYLFNMYNEDVISFNRIKHDDARMPITPLLRKSFSASLKRFLYGKHLQEQVRFFYDNSAKVEGVACTINTVIQ